jgi:hypothetical protein
MWGIALIPTPRQRTIWVNEVPFPTEPRDQYTCDGCGAPIKPGERCCAYSLWPEWRRLEPWEHEYLTQEGGRHGSQLHSHVIRKGVRP